MKYHNALVYGFDICCVLLRLFVFPTAVTVLLCSINAAGSCGCCESDDVLNVVLHCSVATCMGARVVCESMVLLFVYEYVVLKLSVRLLFIPCETSSEFRRKVHYKFNHASNANDVLYYNS